jgi:hypothetical protein
MRCDWCGLLFCKDCVDPRKHNCISYDPSQPKPTSVSYKNKYSKKLYDDFAPPDQLEPHDERHLHLSNAEMENHRIEGNLIYQERIRLGVSHLGDTCPNCHSSLNKADEKCKLCDITFCGYCIDPAKHRCVIYQSRYGAFPEAIVREKEFIPKPVIAPKNELVIESEPERAPETNKGWKKKTTNKRERVFIPKPVTEPKNEPVIESESEPELVQVQQPEPVREVVQRPESVEVIQVENKISLWQRFLSILGFGKIKVNKESNKSRKA